MDKKTISQKVIDDPHLIELYCPNCGELNSGNFHITKFHKGVHYHTQTYNDHGIYRSVSTGYQTIELDTEMRCKWCEADISQLMFAVHQRDPYSDRWKPSKPEPPSKYKSYGCNCAGCIKGETCGVKGCDKPAKLAFIIAYDVMDTSTDLRFRACDNEAHIRKQDLACYKMENGE